MDDAIKAAPPKAPRRDTIIITAFLLLVLIIWATLGGISSARIVEMRGVDGVCDFLDVDFDNAIYLLTGDSWEQWGERLYSPEDFASGLIEEPKTPDFTQVQYATHRISLLLPPGKTYGLSMKSNDYSMRLFIGGEQVDLVGVPGATKEETTPRTQDRVYYFSPQEEKTEIIAQAANFVHRYGGYTAAVYVGSYQNIDAKRQSDALMSNLIIGCLLLSCLYHLALFLMNRRQKAELLFSICCFLLIMLTNRVIPTLFPEYNWYIAFRVEYIVHYATFAMMMLFIHVLFPGRLHKWVVRVFSVLCGVFILTVLIFDTVLFSEILMYFYYVSPVAILYVVVRMAMGLRRGGMEQWIAFIGIFAVSLFAFFDLISYMPGPLYPLTLIISLERAWGMRFTTPVGMVFFVFCYALLLAMQNAKTKRREEELTMQTELLHKLNRRKTEFLQDIDHELRTPLAVVSTGIEVITEQTNKGDGSKETINHTLDTIQNQTQRIGRMLGAMANLASMSDISDNRVRVDFAALLRHSGESFRMELSKRNTDLRIDVAHGLPDAYIERDRFTQVISNLFSNAARHTQGGLVTLEAEFDAKYIIVTVADTGEGIAPEMLLRVFERGVSGGSGSGLGLYICKAIVEAHGGTIEIKSVPGEGTVVTFSVPVYGGQEAGHEV